MKQTVKRTLAWVLSVCLVAGMLPMNARAEEETDAEAEIAETAEAVPEEKTPGESGSDEEQPEEEQEEMESEAPPESEETADSEEADLPALAAASDIKASGSCGTNVYWTLTTDGVLTIYGTGAMEKYSYSNSSPWSSYRSSIQSVIIHAGVISIGSVAFSDCSSLTSVTIPEGVTSIGYSAFSGCSSLTSVTIPEDVTSIGNYAFYNCSNLTSVTIPEGVTFIGSEAFFGCSSLTNIEVNERNQYYSSLDGVLFNKAQTTLIQCPEVKSGAYAIPEGVTSIGRMAFSGCSSLTSVTIPEGVTSIGYSAFSGCSSLTSIDIPAGVTSIGGGAFGGCSSLTSIEVSENNPIFSSLNGGLFNKKQTELFLCPEGKRGAFYIPEGVTSIVERFYGCSSLTSIEVSENNPNFSSLNGGLFNKKQTELIRCPEGKRGAFYIPEGVTSIGGMAFYNCASLTSIHIPDGVTSIEESAFYGCRLKHIYYAGTPAEWSQIVIADNNWPLYSAEMHFHIVLSGTISAQTVAGRPGDTVTVALNLAENAGFAYAKFTLDYDKELTLVSAENQTVLDLNFTASQTTAVKPYVMQWNGSGNAAGSGTIVLLTFRISETAEDGEYPLTLVCEEAYDEQLEDVNFSIETPIIKVISSIPGDANGDGKINGKDSILLAQYLAGWNVTIDTKALDVNKDGRVNGKDSILLAQFLAGWNVTLK